MFQISRKAAVQLVVVLAAAAALKEYYSTATANDLLWILWPTARLTELATGMHFRFESYAGYMSSDRSFLIASICAGVNFLVAAFLMLSLRRLWSERMTGASWRFLPVAAAAAFAVTIIANAVRISSAVYLNRMHYGLAGLDRDEIHRIDGIIVYFGFLLMLFMLSGRKDLDASRSFWPRYLFPLAIYYGATLGVPLAGGAFRLTAFWEHCVFVLATPIVLIVPMILIMYVRNTIFPELNFRWPKRP